MIVHTCPTCQRNFNQKSTFNKHLARKIKCTNDPKNNSNTEEIHGFECDKCEKIFSRRDSLNRHLQICTVINKKIEHNINIYDNNDNNDMMVNNGDHNNIENNENNITINYNLVPFGKDGTKCLTSADKMAIFSSNVNPMQEIIRRMHLDPEKPNHHNVGIPDSHSGNCVIYDESGWRHERLNTGMSHILTTKLDDLREVKDHLEGAVDDKTNRENERVLNDLNRTVHARDVESAKSQKSLIAHVKTDFCNGKDLVIRAKKATYKNISPDKAVYKNIVKKGMTQEEAIRHIDNMGKIQPSKKTAMYFLDNLLNKSIINENMHKQIAEIIKKSTHKGQVSTIIKYIVFGKKININGLNQCILRSNDIETVSRMPDFMDYSIC